MYPTTKRPWEHHQSEVRPKSSSYTKCHKRQNYQKGWYTLIIIFSVNLPLVFIYKFCKKEIKLQQPGKPWEHRLGEVPQGRLKSKFNMTLSYSIVMFFWVQVLLFRKLEISYFKILGSNAGGPAYYVLQPQKVLPFAFF